MQAPYISQLPITTPTCDLRATIEAVVHRLLNLRRQGPEIAGLEAELNALVYQVYGLTEEEIALIENDLRAGQSGRGGQETPGAIED